jgi:hypothetical protein
MTLTSPLPRLQYVVMSRLDACHSLRGGHCRKKYSLQVPPLIARNVFSKRPFRGTSHRTVKQRAEAENVLTGPRKLPESSPRHLALRRSSPPPKNARDRLPKAGNFRAEYLFFANQHAICCKCGRVHALAVVEIPRELGLLEDFTMPRGDKSSYSSKQKRQASHIEEGYEKRGTPKKEAERRAWATVNKETGGGKKSGSGRGKKTTTASSRKGGKKGGARSHAGRSRSRSSSR